MGQLALGLRSLAVKIAIFIVLAALLAWVLGGTLFPSPQQVNFPVWPFGGRAWNWRVKGDAHHAAPVAWSLMVRGEDGSARSESFDVEAPWSRVWGPRFDDGHMFVAVESRAESESAPTIILLRISKSGSVTDRTRLASESELPAELVPFGH